MAVEDYVFAAFEPAFRMCEAKEEPPAVFVRIMREVELWSESTLAQEVDDFRTKCTGNAEEVVHASFVAFVRNLYQRPGAPPMQIRLAPPPLRGVEGVQRSDAATRLT